MNGQQRTDQILVIARSWAATQTAQEFRSMDATGLTQAAKRQVALERLLYGVIGATWNM